MILCIDIYFYILNCILKSLIFCITGKTGSHRSSVVIIMVEMKVFVMIMVILRMIHNDNNDNVYDDGNNDGDYNDGFDGNDNGDSGHDDGGKWLVCLYEQTYEQAG